MLWMKQGMTSLLTLTLTRRVAAMGLIGCLMLAFTPLGCANSIETAPLRYREQHRNDGHLLPDITVQRLQACVEKYGHQLEPRFYRVDAKVKANQNAQIRNAAVEGIPDSAPDLAACTRITLREMSLPTSVRQLRPGDTIGATDRPLARHRNEAGNVIVVGIVILLGEFVVEYGGYTILFAVTLDLVHEAIKTIQEKVQEEDENKKQCDAELTACLLTSLADLDGNVYRSSRCVMCYDGCLANNGVWPYRMMKGTRWATCDYRSHK